MLEKYFSKHKLNLLERTKAGKIWYCFWLILPGCLLVKRQIKTVELSVVVFKCCLFISTLVVHIFYIQHTSFTWKGLFHSVWHWAGSCSPTWLNRKFLLCTLQKRKKKLINPPLDVTRCHLALEKQETKLRCCVQHVHYLLEWLRKLNTKKKMCGDRMKRRSTIRNLSGAETQQIVFSDLILLYFPGL